MDGSNRGRDAHIPTEIRQESEGQILAGPMGGWGVGHTTSDRFTRSRGVHSLHRYVEAKGQLCCRLSGIRRSAFGLFMPVVEMITEMDLKSYRKE